MRYFVTFVTLFCFLVNANCQEQSLPEKSPANMNIGLGFGLDYGGFGGRFTFLPSDRIALFGAVGYNLVGLGFNGGVNFRISPQKKICPFIGAMYGYNGAIKVSGSMDVKEAYYGPSFSFGTEIWSFLKNNYFNIELILPLRPSAFKTDYEDLKDMGVEFKVPSIPIAFSLGYHFAF